MNRLEKEPSALGHMHKPIYVEMVGGSKITEYINLQTRKSVIEIIRLDLDNPGELVHDIMFLED